MSSPHFKNGGYGFCGEMNISPSTHVPSSSSSSHLQPSLPNPFGMMGHAGDTESERCDKAFQILSPSVFHPQENPITRRTIDEGDDGNFGVESKSLSLKLGEEVEAKSSSATGKIGYTKLCVRGHWRPAEDAKLKELVAEFGPQNWNSIAEHLKGRSGKSCRLRWFNQLDPRINKMPFSEEEEERLLTAHKMYGNKWAMISKFFPGRTDNAVKNHWHVIMSRRQREESSVYRRRKPTFQSFPNGLNLTLSNNVASESTMSSPIDESASTCTTNLSLTTSSANPIPRPFHNMNPVQNYQAFGSLMSLYGESRVPTKDVGFDNIFSAWNGSHVRGSMVKLMGVDQSNYSDSNSEVSVSESVANKKINLSISGESANGGDKINMPFIDFLGVGAT
ncbi:transcription factor MYB52-like [Gastrolobium bilobum]|uniref:transcription factor MYB52-like n=1 Tax=Gastrolobium bilobum TaxID=150636 RepID=UPI002AAF2581|nr:transcription factor MYB52-like [Gastrolobium bilobum]